MALLHGCLDSWVFGVESKATSKALARSSEAAAALSAFGVATTTFAAGTFAAAVGGSAAVPASALAAAKFEIADIPAVFANASRELDECIGDFDVVGKSGASAAAKPGVLDMRAAVLEGSSYVFVAGVDSGLAEGVADVGVAVGIDADVREVETGIAHALREREKRFVGRHFARFTGSVVTGSGVVGFCRIGDGDIFEAGDAD